MNINFNKSFFSALSLPVYSPISSAISSSISSSISFSRHLAKYLSVSLCLSLSLSLSLSAGVLLSNNAQARELNSSGVYIDGGFGWGQVAESNIPGLADANGIGWNANLGYQFNKHIGAEVGYMSLPRVKNNGVVVIKDNYAIDLAVKGSIQVHDKLGVYGKVGVAKVTSKYTSYDGINNAGHHDAVVPLFAVGASYGLNDNSYVGLEGLMTTKSGPVPSMRAVTFNVGYIF